MPRRAHFYGEPVAAVKPAAPSVEPIRGARAIAELLGLRTRQVYAMVEAHKGQPDAPPITSVAGVGLVADRHTLLAWWARRLGASAA